MKTIINEFKEFIMRGSTGSAVGVIIGGAFQKNHFLLVNVSSCR